VAHPTYCGVHDKLKMLAFGAGPGSGDQFLARYQPVLDAWEASERAAGRLTDMFSDDAESLHFQSAGRLPIGDGALTESVDGQAVAPLMGVYAQSGEYDGAQTGCVFNVLSTLLATSDHAVLFRFTPRGPLLSDAEAIWLVRGDAVEGVDYNADRLTALWDITLSEDKRITEDNQSGIRSEAYRPGPFSTQEQRIADFGRWYMKRLEANRGARS